MFVSKVMAMKMPLLLLLSVICVSLLPVPGSGTLCLRGEDDPISLCAMCSDKYAAVRWNRSDAVTWRSMEVKYTCVDPQNSTTQVLSSDQDSCFDSYPHFSTGVAAIGAEIAAGVRCDFSVIFRYMTAGRIKSIRINSSCTIRSTETCETNPEECHLDQTCGVHEEGNCSECYCTPGYSGEECININECASNSTNTCHEQADCYDTEGSYECVCKAGYEGDGYNNCSDINECEHIDSPCHENAQCTNSDGNFSCECNTGYTGDGYSNCSDIDECEPGSVCHEAASCINTMGSYDCECSPGYKGNGHNACSDIDECVLTEGPCHEDAECTNTKGSYECECKIGYEGDGYHCTDIDECRTMNYTCSEAADCVNTNGSYECVCWTGYHKVGNNCTESLPPFDIVPVVVSGVIAGAFLLVLLLLVLVLVNRYLSYRSNRLPRDILPLKDLDLFYTPTFSGWKGSMTSIHSVYEELKFPTSLSLLTDLGSTQQLSTPTDQDSVKTLDNDSINITATASPPPPPPPPAVVFVPSIKQEVSGSPGCTTMPSQASDYHQVNGVTASKEPEQEQFSMPAMDTISISEIIAAMEEDAAPSTVGQATNTTYLPNHANPEARICDSTRTTSSPPTSTTQPQPSGIGYVHPQPQEFTSVPVTSSSTQPLSTTRGEGNTATSPPQSEADSGKVSIQPISTARGYTCEGDTSPSPPQSVGLGNGSCFSTRPISTARGYIYEGDISATFPPQSAPDSGNGSSTQPISTTRGSTYEDASTHTRGSTYKEDTSTHTRGSTYEEDASTHTRGYTYEGDASTFPPQSTVASGNGSSSSTHPIFTAMGYIYEENTNTSPPPQLVVDSENGSSSSNQPISTARGYMHKESNTSPAVDSGNRSLDMPFSEDSSDNLSFGEWPSLQYTANSISSGYVSESVASESEECRHESCVFHELSYCHLLAMTTTSSSMENRPRVATDTENMKMAIDKYEDSAQQSKQFEYSHTHVPTFTGTDSCWQTSAKEPTPEFVSDFDQAMEFDTATTNHQFQYVNCIIDHIKDIEFDLTPQTASV